MSVLSHLTTTASNLLLRGPSASGVATSIATLQARLNAHFSSTDVREHFAFGSWKRDTNLPREVDQYSDVDYMVVFFGDNSTKPQTLLDRLKRFVEVRYSTSEVKQSHPTVVLSLNHIHFELVPSIRSWNISTGPLQIPSSSSVYTNWQTTDPHAANAQVEAHNGNNKFLSKPLIRLLKYWNCLADPYGRSFDSFELEQFVITKYYYPNANLKDYVFGAVENMSLDWSKAESKRNRITRLKEIIARTKQYEQQDLQASAELEIKKAFPLFS